MKYVVLDLSIISDEIHNLAEVDERYQPLLRHLDAALREAVNQDLIDEDDV